MQSAISMYQSTQCEGAGPARLILMLYDGFITALGRAQTAVEGRRFEQAHKELIRAQDIVSELMACLRSDGEGLSDRLRAIYGFLLESLFAANVKKDVSMMRRCVEIMTPLRDAWEASCVGQRSETAA
jgi:flagellar protein FliS